MNAPPSNTNQSEATEISLGGRITRVPSVGIRGRTICVSGRWLRIAAVKDEDLVEGDPVDDPPFYIEELKRSALGADLFTFAQNPVDAQVRHPYRREWDNAAVIALKDYDQWWSKLSQETRRNVKKSVKAGIRVEVVPFGDELVRGIVEIYNETPVRQGRRFWHYGKDFATVKQENGTFVSQSDFLGAYWNGELVGFAKIVYVGATASIMQILSKQAHQDKKSSNALIAKAVELACARGKSFLIYCKYVYGKNDDSPLTEFKRRNGFEKFIYPRYFVPLTHTGSLALKLNLHHGVKGMLPDTLTKLLLRARAGTARLVNGKRGERPGGAA